MKAESKRMAWQGYMRVLARNFKIKFVWGQNPETDGNVVWLPPLPPKMGKDEVNVIEAFSHHEIGHVMHTNFDYFTQFGITHGPALQLLLNAIEDPWQEKRHAKIRFGIERILREKPILAQKLFRVRTGENSPLDALGMVMMATSHVFINKWTEYKPVLDVAKSHFIRFMGDDDDAVEMAELVIRIIKAEGAHCQSTADNGKLVLRVVEALKQAANRSDAKTNSDQNDSEGSTESDDEADGNADGESEGSTGSDDESEGNAGGDSEGSTGSDDESEGNAGGDSEGSTGSDDEAVGNAEGDSDCSSVADDNTESQCSASLEAEAEMASTSKKELMKQILSDEVEAGELIDLKQLLEELSEKILSGETEYSPDDVEFMGSISSAGDTLPDEKKYAVVPDLIGMQLLKESIGNKPAVMSSRLVEMLRDSVEEPFSYSRRGSKMRCSRLYRAVIENDPAVFKRVEEVENGMASVTVLVDLSGSTEWYKSAPTIHQTTMLLNDTLGRMDDLKFEIIGFGSQYSECVRVKSFNEDYRSAQPTIGGLHGNVGGSTPLTPALIEAGYSQAETTSTKKVIIVLTDGDPDDLDGARAQCEHLTLQGVYLVYVLIGTDVKQDWLKEDCIAYEHAITFDTIPSATLKALSHALL